MTLPEHVGQRGLADILRWYDGKGMFTEEQLRACVLDGGTRFVAPGQVTYDEDGWIEEVSAERKALQDEDARRVLPALGDAVEQPDHVHVSEVLVLPTNQP